MVNVSRENRRFGRVIMDKALRVSMRSIGSEASYNMETRNVSDTGFFLRFEKPGRFPFTPSSIMEVWLTLEEGSTIFFNGRMTRVVHPEEAVSLDTEPGIAIRIIQIEKEEENILREFIRKKALEKEANAQSSVPSKDEGVDTPPLPSESNAIDTPPVPAESEAIDTPPVPAESEAIDTPPVPVQEEKAVTSKKKTRRKATKKKTTTRAKVTSSKTRRRKKAASVEQVVSIATATDASDNVPPPPEVEEVVGEDEKEAKAG